MAKYKLVADKISEVKSEDGFIRYEPNIVGIRDTESNLFIPLDPSNRHYQQYQKWIQEGNEPDPPFTLEEVKRLKKSEIKSEFNRAFSEGFISPTLKIKVDCKREDLLNLKNALDYAKTNNLSEITIRDYNNNYHTITVDQLDTLVKEVSSYHVELYQRKWNLDNQIDQASSFEEVCSIKWRKE